MRLAVKAPGNWKNYCKYFFYTVVIGSYTLATACSRQKEDIVDIFLNDAGTYTRISEKEIYNEKYPPANLFDARLNTCWVSGSAKDKKKLSIFIKLPESGDIILNIFPGYGKSKKLFEENARPKKLIFSILAAVNPDGYVTEEGALYKTKGSGQSQVVDVEDRFGVQSFPLSFDKKALSELKAGLLKYFHDHFEAPVADTCFILKVEIAEIYPGTKYDDICLSEIFFNDRFVTADPLPPSRIGRIYLNTDENKLLADIGGEKGVAIFSDTTAVLQIIEQSKNKKWAILISMPAEAGERAETTYLLADLLNKKIVNRQLEKCTGYPAGSELFFEDGNGGEQYAVFTTPEGADKKIALY